MATPLYAMRSYKYLCNESDINALKNFYDSNKLSTIPHSMDNSFIESSYGLTCENLRQMGCEIVAVCYNTPWMHAGRNCGVVYCNCKDKEDMNWVHVNEIILGVWNKEVE